MCSWSANALLRCSIKRSTLIASSSLEAPLQWAGRTKMLCKFSLRARMTIYGSHAYDCLVLGCLFLFICNALDLEVTCLDSFMQRPSIHPYAYRTRILLFTVTVPIATILLLLLLCC